MSYSQAIDPRVSDLTALVESIVEQVLGRTLNKQLTSWVVNNPHISSRLTYLREGEQDETSQVFGAIGHFGNMLNYVGKELKSYYGQQGKLTAVGTSDGLAGFGARLAGVAGVVNAFQTGDPIGGAMAGVTFGPIGAAVGFLAGLFGGPKKIDRWDRPKFTPAKQAYDRLFTMDRGEEDLYYMPESFYFRTGSTGPRMITVKLGNNQFDDHIRDSLTNNYASQLQRGLVF